MSHRLPSLSAVRAFEAAARRLSFTRAAQELHVTQIASSHQIRAPEDLRGLIFTDSGMVVQAAAEGQGAALARTALAARASASRCRTWLLARSAKGARV